LSQLALLQQLASQSTASAQPAALPLPAFPSAFPPFPNHSSVPQQVNTIPHQQPAASSSTSYNDTYRQPNNGNNWNQSSDGASSRARPTSPDRRPGGRISRWEDANDEAPQRRNRNQRSNSPFQSQFSQDRRQSPPKERDERPPTQRRNNWGSRADRDYSSSSRAGPAQVQLQETQRIATFISEDRDDAHPMKGQAGKGRQDYDSSDFSSFEVKPTVKSQTSQTQVPQNNISNQGTDFQQQPQSLEMSAQSASYMMNPAVFDPSSFNPMDPASWASFAMFCQQNMGYLPSNMEMCQWIMGSMAMMQNATAQMNGGSSMFGMQGTQDMQGMQQMQGGQNVQNMQGVLDESNDGQNAEDQFNSRFNSQQDWDNYASNQDTIAHETADGSPDTKQLEAKDPSSAGNDEGEGEADMSMTPEPEEG
jgi:protein NRD1